MEFVKDLGGEEIPPDEAVEHRLGQPVPQQGADDPLPDGVGVIDPGGQHRLRRHGAVGPQVPVGAGGSVRPGLFPEAPQGLQTPGLVAVVRVQKGDIRPPDIVQAQVPGLADAAVALLVEHPDAVVLTGQLVAQGRGAVGAAVVHQQQLPVGKGLAADAFHTVPEKFLRLIDGHDDGNAGHRRSPPRAGRRAPAVSAGPAGGPQCRNIRSYCT